MYKNRDFTRKNKANQAIKGCLYSKINLASLQSIESKLTNSIDDETKNDCMKLLEIAKASNDNMVNLFAESQTSISKKTCFEYCQSQHNTICNSIKNYEDPNTVENIS